MPKRIHGTKDYSNFTEDFNQSSANSNQIKRKMSEKSRTSLEVIHTEEQNLEIMTKRKQRWRVLQHIKWANIHIMGFPEE